MNQLHFFIRFFLGCTQREGNSNESIVEEYKRCSKHETLLERNSKVNFLGHLFREKQSFGLVVWRVMRRNVWQDIASWKIKRLIKCTKSLLHAWATISSKRKNWKLFENFQKFAPKSSWHACVGRNGWIWHILVCKHICTSCHAMDQSFWPTFGMFDLLHSPHEWVTGTIVMWVIRQAGLSIGIVPILRFWWRLWRL